MLSFFSCVLWSCLDLSAGFFLFLNLRMISLEIVCPGSGVVLDCIEPDLCLFLSLKA